MLGIDHHLLAFTDEIFDRVCHHRNALIERGHECLGDVIVPAFGHDAHGRCACTDEVGERGVFIHLAFHATGGAEGHQDAGLELEFGGGATEELFVLRVGAGPAALNVSNAQAIELLGNTQLVFHRDGHAFKLAAVAKGGVEDLYLFHRCLQSLWEKARTAPMGR